MQTFVPSDDMWICCQCLDNKRLNKQIVETWQIYETLVGGGKWKHHPAVLMWRGYEPKLLVYGVSMYIEWQLRLLYGERGGSLVHKSGASLLTAASNRDLSKPYPPWWGDDRVHASHRSNLLRKLPTHYRQFWPKERDDLPYFWPTKEGY